MCVFVFVVVFVCVSVMGCFSRCRFAYRDRNDGVFFTAKAQRRKGLFSIVFNRLLLPSIVICLTRRVFIFVLTQK